MRKLAILGTGDADVPGAPTPPPIVAAAERFEPELRTVPDAVFPDTPRNRTTCERAYLSAGLRAESDGYAGVYVNTVGDYGLAQLRQSCTVPVTGAGEGAIRAALARAERFAIVTIWPPAMAFLYDPVLEANGARGRCAAITHLSQDQALSGLDQPDNFLTQMQSCAPTSMAAIRAACREALDTQGADVIVLGCTCMQPVAELLEADGFPVIEPMVAGYRRLESMVGTVS